MKDPVIELMYDGQVVLKLSLWTLLYLHFFESENIPADLSKLRLYLDGEEVEYEEEVEDERG